MTQDIERLAKEAGLRKDDAGYTSEWSIHSVEPEHLAKFAALIAEECAKVCEAQLADGECPERAQYCADAIRAKFALSNEEHETK
jgi:hypothetical protein